MRFIYAFIAMFLWALFLVGTGTKGSLSADAVMLTFAVVAAGALAGGGDKEA